MKIGKISGIDYRSLGVSEKIPFKKALYDYLSKSDDEKDEIVFSQKRKAHVKENLPEFGVLLTSFVVGGIILCGLLGGKKV